MIRKEDSIITITPSSPASTVEDDVGLGRGIVIEKGPGHLLVADCSVIYGEEPVLYLRL